MLASCGFTLSDRSFRFFLSPESALEADLDIPILSGLRSVVPLYQSQSDAPQSVVLVDVLAQQVHTQTSASGGGARRAESILTLQLDYRLRLPDQPQTQDYVCYQSNSYPLNEIRPLASLRLKERLLEQMASDCGRQMQSRASLLMSQDVLPQPSEEADK
ncbi:MAG: hypothetical protein ACR2PW_08055 [Gammaproteobacteria bacterium]